MNYDEDLMGIVDKMEFPEINMDVSTDKPHLRRAEAIEEGTLEINPYQRSGSV